MSGDFSRSTFDPRRHYSGVRMQQGRVQLDADWNEQVDIAEDALRARTLDIVGWSGAPEGRAGFGLVADSTLVFDGHGALVEAPAREEYAFSARDHVTIEAVIAPRAGGAGGTILSAGHLLLTLEEGGRLSFRHAGADGALVSRSLPWDRPRRVVAVYDGETTRIHVDGEEVASAKAVRTGAGEPHLEVVELYEEISASGGVEEVVLLAPRPQRHRGVALRIGGTRAGGGASFDGAIRSVRVWKSSFLSSDLRALATRTFTDDPLLVGSFHLDDGAGERLRDRSLLRNDALLAGPEGHRPRWRLNALRVEPGCYYVGGILCENEAAVSFEAQPDLPGEKLPTEEGIYLAVLDVWERVVSALEDPRLREVALGGPDTAVRTKVVWQVRLLRPPPGLHDREESALAWRSLAESTAGSGTMRACCQLGAGSELLGNRLYRVEIHDEGEAFGSPFPDHGAWIEVSPVAGEPTALQASGVDDPGTWSAGRWVELSGRGEPLLAQLVGAPRVSGEVCRLTLSKPVGAGTGPLRMRLVATFKWSRNNGLDALPIRAIEAVPATATAPATTAVTLAEPVGHHGATLREGDWVEIVGERALRRGDPAPIAKIQSIGYDHRTLTLAAPVPWDASVDRPVLVRRWDRDAAAPDQGVAPVQTGWTDLEHGIAVQFTGSSPYHAGHHWFIAARAQLRGIEWPEDERGPVACAPRGSHCFGRLALVRVGAGGVRVEDLRSTFVPLARLRTPGAELVGPITIRGSLHVTGEAVIDEDARARWVAGALPAASVESPQLADHAVTAPKIASHAVHPQHLAAGVGVVPDGFAILGSSPVPPPGFVYTHQQLEVHNPRPAWKPQPALPQGHEGRVVLVTVGEALYALCEHDRAILRHDEAEARWTRVGEMSAHRPGFGAAAAGREIHIVGGLDAHGLARADHEIFDTAAGGTARLERARLGAARARLGVAAVGGHVFAIGGVEGLLSWPVRDFLIGLGLPRSLFRPYRSSDAVEVYDPGGRRWRPLPSMPTARGDFGVGVINDRVHVVGGLTLGLFTEPQRLRSHEVFTPARRLWETRMPLRTPRDRLGAAVVEGRLYATGGLGPKGALATVEVYTPLGDTWQEAARLPAPRHDHGSSGLFGDVFVAGGRPPEEGRGSVASCAMASTLFLHRKVTPGEEAGVTALLGPAPEPAHALQAHPAVLEAARLPAAALLRRGLVLAAVLALVAALVYGYAPGPPSRVPAPGAASGAAPPSRVP